MDPGRLLTIVATGLTLAACAMARPSCAPAPPPSGRIEPVATPAARVAVPVPRVAPVVAMAPIPNPPAAAPKPRRAHRHAAGAPRAATGRAAIAVANVEARAPARSDAFVGGVQVFSYEPGKVYEVWAAPLRVTLLMLPPGETVVAKAAGDTVRWQIGETTSGSGAGRRADILLKPLRRGLETNLVLTTTERVYMLQLRSGAPGAFNAAITWRAPPLAAVASAPPAASAEAKTPDPVVTPLGPVDARYRIVPRGRRPRWTPTAVFNDGVRTFIAFSPDLPASEAPVLFELAPGGAAQIVNYRLQGGVFIVDRVLDRAELRLGDRHPQVVRIERLGGVS
jgi:type IV secretion system protein VirB9